MLKKTIISLTLTLAAISANAIPQSVLDLDCSLNDSKLILPESFETDVYQMRHNWYLQTYAQTDSLADFRSDDVDFPDEVSIDLLQ